MTQSIKLNNELIKKMLAQKNDPAVIYKLHMAQARDAKKQFKDNPEALAKIDVIIANIKQTYKDSVV